MIFTISTFSCVGQAKYEEDVLLGHTKRVSIAAQCRVETIVVLMLNVLHVFVWFVAELGNKAV